MEFASDESRRAAERRLPLSDSLNIARKKFIEVLEEEGFSVDILHEVWMMASLPETHGARTVQIEIDPRGVNLDMVLISDMTDNLGGGFPLGGGFVCSSTVKLALDNVDFAVKRLKSFFGIVEKDDQHGQANWEKVQDHLKFEKSVRENP